MAPKNQLLISGLWIASCIAHPQEQRNVISQTVARIPDVEIITSESLERGAPTFAELCKDVTFTRSGLTCYFKHIYNCHKYAQEALPSIPFKHLTEFLEHGKSTNQPSIYTKAVFKLFDKKIKEAPYICATELLTFLQKLPNLIQKELINGIGTKKDIKQLIRFDLENHFDFLKTNPDGFIDQLAQKIVDKSHLNYTISALISTCLNKVSWCVADQQETWKNFIALGQELTKLHDLGIIADRDALDDCVWALNIRFSFFLSLPSAARLPFEFFEQARNDMRCGIKHFTELPEQEDLITNKTQYLHNAIKSCFAHANGRQRESLISEVIDVTDQ